MKSNRWRTKCEAEACVEYAKTKVKIAHGGDDDGGTARTASLCERHASREKNDPGSVELAEA